jgi:phytoene dehydrogenase-like protein
LSNDFDAAVIGSGIGGLTCAALLSRCGMRTVVLERFSRIGGCAQEFSRNGFTFDSSVHSVSMGEGGFVSGLLAQLGVRKKLDIVPNTSTARVLSPGFSYTLPADLGGLTDSLCRSFPQERGIVPVLLSDMERLFAVYKGNLSGGEASLAPPGIGPTSTYREYIEHFVADPRLRFLLGSIWPFGGSSPSIAPFYNAFIFIAHALEGSHYVKGGFAAFAQTLADAITASGGEVRTRWAARSLRIERGRVVAVINDRGEELSARVVVSNISPYLLHRTLIPEPSRKALWLRRLENLSPSVSAVCVYLGLEGDAADIAEHSLTLWFGSNDHDAIYRRIQSGLPADIDHLVIVRPPDPARGACITLIHLVKQQPGVAWHDEKKRIADAMIKKATEVLGDFTPRIRVRETASPDTFERYTGNTAGAMYGFENASDLYGRSKLPFTTYIPNLFQAGHWTKAGGGIYNVMASGKAVADMILKQK